MTHCKSHEWQEVVWILSSDFCPLHRVLPLWLMRAVPPRKPASGGAFCAPSALSLPPAYARIHLLVWGFKVLVASHDAQGLLSQPFFSKMTTNHYPAYCMPQNVFYLRNRNSLLWKMREDVGSPHKTPSWFCQMQLVGEKLMNLLFSQSTCCEVKI